jgi:hypothetical protein
MHRHVLRLGNELGLGVEDGAGRIHALLDVGRKDVSFSTPPISWAVASSALRSTSSVIGSNARA